MATFVSNRDSGGETNEKGHLKFWSKTIDGHVLSGQQVVASSPLAMSVRITEGDIRIPYADYAHMAWSEGYTSVTIATADPTNPRIDRIVAYIDRAMVMGPSDINNPGMLKYKSVTGSPNSSPVKVSDSAVDTSVSGNPWVELGTVRVNASVTTISDANITDTRIFAIAALTPTGTVSDFAGLSAPSGWLMCYGQAISRTTYANLFSIIGTTFGAGNGSTTFNVPDLRGRVIAGQDDMGGTSANRLTGSVTGSIDGDVFGSTGGQEAHTLILTEIPSHNHNFNDPGHNHGVYDPGHSHGFPRDVVVTWNQNNQRTYLGGGSGQQLTWSQMGSTNGSGTGIGIYGNTTGITIQPSGGDQPHNVVQPTMILNKIIKY